MLRFTAFGVQAANIVRCITINPAEHLAALAKSKDSREYRVLHWTPDIESPIVSPSECGDFGSNRHRLCGTNNSQVSVDRCVGLSFGVLLFTRH